MIAVKPYTWYFLYEELYQEDKSKPLEYDISPVFVLYKENNKWISITYIPGRIVYSKDGDDTFIDEDDYYHSQYDPRSSMEVANGAQYHYFREMDKSEIQAAKRDYFDRVRLRQTFDYIFHLE